MIIDVTGIELIPGNNGADCPGNGEHVDKNEIIWHVAVMNVTT